jgi:hypothetical protein
VYVFDEDIVGICTCTLCVQITEQNTFSFFSREVKPKAIPVQADREPEEFIDN